MKTSSKVKNLWHATGKGLSLKTFVKELAATGDEAAKEWFENKKEKTQKAAQQLREKVKGPILSLIRQASKNARNKTKA